MTHEEPLGDTHLAARVAVEQYLLLCGRRDVDAAQDLLIPGAVLEFPGGKQYTSVREMASQAEHRYQSVTKRVSGWRCATLDTGGELVVCFGTLSGLSLNGKQFSGVRFVDVFEVRSQGISSQRVWNDLAEDGVVVAGGEEVEQ